MDSLVLMFLVLVIGASVSCVVFLVTHAVLSRQSAPATQSNHQRPELAPIPPPPGKMISQCIVSLHVETTGTSDKDRIVTLAGVKLSPSSTSSEPRIEYINLVFDPGRKSQQLAEAVHGYSDWTLRHQTSFQDSSDVIDRFLDAADLVVAHNADFVIGSYNREGELARHNTLTKPTFCTLSAYLGRGDVENTSLAAACQKAGAARAPNLYGPLEKAWLTLQLYLWLNDFPLIPQPRPELTGRPSNFRSAPPLPEGPIPRRKRLSNLPTEDSTPSPRTVLQ